MRPDDPRLLGALAEQPCFPWAVLGQEGGVLIASREFERLQGLGATPADWLKGGAREGQTMSIGERHFELRSQPLPDGRLVVLAERTEAVHMEDEVWELQTRLSKVYADLSVKNQTLSATLDTLREREAELEAINRSLEEKVRQQLEQLERTTMLRRYLSPEIANAVLAGDAAALGTRKRVLTVFFADLATFDDLVAEMESEEIIELLCDYNQHMTRIIFAHGGTLDKFISARIMGFFGDPIPQDDHADRAVRMALAMRDQVSQMRRKWFPAGEQVELQVGIHTGYATVGNVGSEGRMDYTVIGKNVAMAAALQQEARPGQVLLSARTYEAVKDLVVSEAVQVALKGSSRPITAYAALAEKARDLKDQTVALEVPHRTPAGGTREEPGPSRLGPYVVLETLGAGGMGKVYKALDERLQRSVALKVLLAELAADRQFIARFQREARALASLNSPHIAQIYYVSDEGEVPPYFAMEFVEGPTLHRLLQDQGRLPLRRALDLTAQIARGLEAAAEHAVIHRDIKPDNIMLTPKGQVKLTDFGLAKRAREGVGITSPGFVMGTPIYMSPEQARGEEVDIRSDIYSLGTVFFHMLVGVPPFRGESALVVFRKHEEEPLPPQATMPPTVSGTVYQLLVRMMAKRREERFQDYPSLLEALENV